MGLSISGDSRGVISIEYAVAATLFLALSAILISGFYTNATYSEEAVAEVELDRISAEVATGIEDVSRLGEQAETTNSVFSRSNAKKPGVEKTIELPQRVGGADYSISVQGEEGSVIVERESLEADEISKESEFDVSGSVTVSNKSLSEGDVTIKYNTTTSTVEVIQ